MEGVVFVALTAAGAELAQQLRSKFAHSEVHGLMTRTQHCDHEFEHTVQHLQQLFRQQRTIVGICAAGILIRALASLLSDKMSEPAVVAVNETGQAVVPLLGGHHGANQIASTIADSLHIQAAITNASDMQYGVALDNPPSGWQLANLEHYKPFVAALLQGEQVRLQNHIPSDWLSSSSLPWSDQGRLSITITTERNPGSATELIYHPATLAIGVGCERGVAAAEVINLVRETLAANHLAEQSVAGFFSIAVKTDEVALHELAREFKVPVRFFSAAILEQQTPRLQNPSALVYREVGCHGVAEGAALAAAGSDGELLVAKTKSIRVTCAIAQARKLIAADDIGQAQGRLAIVGIGPGSTAWRTPQAEAAILAASDLVGYSLYLDLLGDLAAAKTRHDYSLGEEEQRVRAALDLTARGKTVALVCSGDPGIYAMASLVFELIDQQTKAEWQRIAIQVIPGISALQAAAARSGAPLGHDFCAISLSDLLTPWETIASRVKAAAVGDFVIAFYNPVSRRRTTQLQRAVEILKQHRPADTPVVLARNLGREGESISHLPLAELSADKVDMLTIVLVGSSTTRQVGNWVYTPRGYTAKSEPVE